MLPIILYKVARKFYDLVCTDYLILLKSIQLLIAVTTDTTTIASLPLLHSVHFLIASS
jgi:hypothetical protein